MKTYKIILFDLDGVITNPKEGITKSIQYALKKLRIEEKNLDNLTKFIGPPLFHTFNSYYKFPEKKAWKAVKYYQERFGKLGIYENKVYNGIAILLDKLKKSGKKVILVSSKPSEYCIKILEHFQLINYFDKVIGPGMNLKDADKTNLIMQAIRSFPKNKIEYFVMVGDREHDIIGANNNNIDSIGVMYGYGSLKELSEQKATYIINSVCELTEFLI